MMPGPSLLCSRSTCGPIQKPGRAPTPYIKLLTGSAAPAWLHSAWRGLRAPAFASTACSAFATPPAPEAQPVCSVEPGLYADTTTKAAPQELWGDSKHVQQVGVEEAEALYLSLCQRTNEQHVLLVLHAPWCQHCRNVEPEVERLAAGLSHESSLAVVALNTDPAAARFFSTEVLGVHALPSFVLFPRGSRTFYKYKGRAHDSQSLLKFLNMVCNQSADHTWQLEGVGERRANALQTVLTSPLEATRAVWRSAPGPALLVAGGVMALAMLGRAMVQSAERNAHVADPEPEVTTDITPKALVRQIDRVMARMGNLMLRLAGARVGVGIMAAQVEALERQAAAARVAAGTPPPALDATATIQALPAVVDVTAAPAVANPSVEPPIPAPPLVEAGADTAPPAEKAQVVSSDVEPAALTVSQAVEHTHVSVEEARSAPLPGQQHEAAVTGAAVACSGISASEVLRLLQEEGDVDKVVERLLAQGITVEDLPAALDLPTAATSDQPPA